MLVDWIYEWRESASVSCNALWCEEIDRCLAARACETHIHTRPLGIPMYGRFLCRLASLLKIQTRMGRIFFPSYAVGYSDYIWARVCSFLHFTLPFIFGLLPLSTFELRALHHKSRRISVLWHAKRNIVQSTYESTIIHVWHNDMYFVKFTCVVVVCTQLQAW